LLLALNQEADLDYFQGIDDHSFQDSPDYDVPPLIAHELKVDDIKVVFHPSTATPDQLFHFDDYCVPESIPVNLVNPLSDIETTLWLEKAAIHAAEAANCNFRQPN